MRDDPVFPTHNTPPDTETLERFLANEASSDGERQIRQWSGQSSNGMSSAELVRQAIQTVGRAGQRTELAMHTEALRKRLRFEGARSSNRNFASLVTRAPRRFTRGSTHHLSPLAGSAFARGVLGVFIVLLALIPTLRNTLFVSHTPARRYVTGVGEQAMVTLKDGTQMHLAPGSQLESAEGFGYHNRSVSLTGEAYVDVATPTGTPFIIYTGETSTRVLGTRFNIRRYNERDLLQIAVVTGKVMIGGHRTPVTLTRGTMAQVTDSTIVTKQASDIAQYTVWTHGQLVFDDTPVPTVLSTIGRWYGYTFKLADSSIAQQHVSATFNASAPTAAMEDLQIMLDVTMRFNGNVVTLVPKSHTMSRAEERLQARKAHSTYTEKGR